MLETLKMFCFRRIIKARQAYVPIEGYFMEQQELQLQKLLWMPGQLEEKFERLQQRLLA